MADEQPPNSALDVKIDYLRRDVAEIKNDVKEIKAEYLNRREFDGYTKQTDDILRVHSTEIESLIGTRNKTIGALLALQIVWGLIVFLVSKFVN